MLLSELVSWSSTPDGTSSGSAAFERALDVVGPSREAGVRPPLIDVRDLLGDSVELLTLARQRREDAVGLELVVPPAHDR